MSHMVITALLYVLFYLKSLIHVYAWPIRLYLKAQFNAELKNRHNMDMTPYIKCKIMEIKCFILWENKFSFDENLIFQIYFLFVLAGLFSGLCLEQSIYVLVCQKYIVFFLKYLEWTQNLRTASQD